jgi:uncharacterized protein
MVLETVPEEREQDVHRILPALGEAIGDPRTLRDPDHKPLLLHLAEPAREHPRPEAGVVAEELVEAGELQEREVAQEEEGPSLPERAHAPTDRVRLVAEAGLRVGDRLGPSRSRHRYLRCPCGLFNIQRISAHMAGPEARGGTEGSFAFTEFSSADPAATRRFLERAFGWKFQELTLPMGPYLAYEAPGGRGGIRPVRGSEPPSSLTYVRVLDLAEAQRRIESAGARIVLPRVDVPGMGAFFWFEVPGGPVLACWQDLPAPTNVGGTRVP